MASEELQTWIRNRHARTGTAGPVSYWFDGISGTIAIPSKVGPLVSADVPPWLVPGAEIELAQSAGSTFRVIEVAPEMCLVEPPRHAVETEKLVRYWRPAARP